MTPRGGEQEGGWAGEDPESGAGAGGGQPRNATELREVRSDDSQRLTHFAALSLGREVAAEEEEEEEKEERPESPLSARAPRGGGGCVSGLSAGAERCGALPCRASADGLPPSLLLCSGVCWVDCFSPSLPLPALKPKK